MCRISKALLIFWRGNRQDNLWQAEKETGWLQEKRLKPEQKISLSTIE
jgi:hypothetical protein